MRNSKIGGQLMTLVLWLSVTEADVSWAAPGVFLMGYNDGPYSWHHVHVTPRRNEGDWDASTAYCFIQKAQAFPHPAPQQLFFHLISQKYAKWPPLAAGIAGKKTKRDNLFNFFCCCCLFFVFVFCLLSFQGHTRPACQGSQIRGLIGATAAGLCQSHSNARSELHLRPTLQLTAMPPRSLTHWARPGIKPSISWLPVGFVSAAPWWELQNEIFLSMEGLGK